MSYAVGDVWLPASVTLIVTSLRAVSISELRSAVFSTPINSRKSLSLLVRFHAPILFYELCIIHIRQIISMAVMLTSHHCILKVFFVDLGSSDGLLCCILYSRKIWQFGSLQPPN